MSVTKEMINYLVPQFISDCSELHEYEGKSGYNNTTRYIEAGGNKYILRIYESHQDEMKVRLEHEVLLKLNQMERMPFQVPLPLSTNHGKTMVRLNDCSNKIACMYHFIKGDNPVFNRLELLSSFGEKTGALLAVLKELKIELPIVYRPYYEIETAYPNYPIDKVVEWCSNPPKDFSNLNSELSWIAVQLIDFQRYAAKLKKLPHQLIHGDLNESNMLTNSHHEISAILDFEFVTSDLRVMEVAVCISELIVNEPEETILWDKIESYIKGFSAVLQISIDEIEALPILVQLRRLDVFVHFLARYLDGVDDRTVLEEQIRKTAANKNWLSQGGNKLKVLFRKSLETM